MAQISRYAILFIAFFINPGLSMIGMTSPESDVTQDKTYYDTGLKYLENKQYLKARLAFQQQIQTYPDSNLSALSYLAIGDSYYVEGGAQNLQAAEEQYKNFIIFYTARSKVLESQMKLFSSKITLIETSHRDRDYIIGAEQEMKSFLERHANSDYAPIVSLWLKAIQEILIRSEQGDQSISK
jgi:outer membrane assembly lipoprotein YfiO